MIPEQQYCSRCEASFNIRNTRTRRIITNIGERDLTEVTLHCPVHKEEVARPSIRLTPLKSKYSFDIITEIGKLRFLEHKQISEIHDHYKKKGIDIPVQTINNLCQRFLQYVVAVHLESFPLLAKLIEKNGGYVLHVDATTTKGRPELLLMKDSWSKIRLLAASIPTEGSEFVSPHLKTLRKHFGKPVAAVKDMGDGIENALIDVFPWIYIIICHYHFLRAVGYRLFDKIYIRFQRRVDRTGIKKKLGNQLKNFKKRKVTEERDQALEFINYILTYKKDGNGIAYPFSLPAVDFYHRCEEVKPKIRKAILERAKENLSSPCLSRLENSLNILKPPPAVRGRIHSGYLRLKERWKWFEKIRKALRYRNGPIPLNTKGFLSNKELERGRKILDNLLSKMGKFVNENKNNHDRTLKRTLRGISELIIERRDNLFVPNLAVEVNGRQKVKRLQRTNNTVEQDFRSMRRHGRRIRGDGDVERLVQKDGVGLAIVKNFEIHEYIRCVYGHLDQMATRFAKVSTDTLKSVKVLFLTSEEGK